MAAVRLLKISGPLGLSFNQEMISNSAISSMRSSRSRQTLMCLGKPGLNCENPTGGCSGGVTAARAAAGCASVWVFASESTTDKGLDSSLILANISNVITKQRQSTSLIQALLEKAIIDCRFFVLLAVAGSLFGSVLCYVEGCFLMVESYFQYFHSISQMSQQGQVVLQLIEAIDMFLVGTAMLIFGTALYVMFVKPDNLKSKVSQHPTLSKNFNKKLRLWMGMGSIMQAKSKMGHAVIMILQVQLLEKFKSIPMTNGLDLAFFAAAIFLSSASIFLLSRISTATPVEAKT